MKEFQNQQPLLDTSTRIGSLSLFALLSILVLFLVRGSRAKSPRYYVLPDSETAKYFLLERLVDKSEKDY